MMYWYQFWKVLHACGKNFLSVCSSCHDFWLIVLDQRHERACSCGQIVGTRNNGLWKLIVGAISKWLWPLLRYLTKEEVTREHIWLQTLRGILLGSTLKNQKINSGLNIMKETNPAHAFIAITCKISQNS